MSLSGIFIADFEKQIEQRVYNGDRSVYAVPTITPPGCLLYPTATKSETNEANGLIAELELQDDEEIVQLNESISQLEEEVEQSDVDSVTSGMCKRCIWLTIALMKPCPPDDNLNVVAGHKRKRKHTFQGWHMASTFSKCTGNSRNTGVAASERRCKERRLEQYKREKNSYCAVKRGIVSLREVTHHISWD